MSRFAIVAAAVVLFMSGCQRRAEVYQFTRFAMGTVVEYSIVAPSRGFAEEAVALAHEEIERVSALLWEGDSTSAVFRFNTGADSFLVDSEAVSLLERAREVHRLSDGAFDPGIQAVFGLYRFDPDDPRVPNERELADTLPHAGMHLLDFRQRRIGRSDSLVGVSVGGIAKGYAVDRAIDVLKRQGIQSALINAGGDLYCLGVVNGQPWTVGVRDPRDRHRLIEVLHLADHAAATSGDYEAFVDVEGTRYHHILDPATGRPARGARSATVVAESTEFADALATAVFVLGPTRGIELIDAVEGVEAMVVDSSGAVTASAGFEGLTH